MPGTATHTGQFRDHRPAGVTVTLTIERPQASVVAQDAPQPQVSQVVEPGLLHVEVNSDAPFVAGHLSARDMGFAHEILTYLCERGALVTACTSGEKILLTIAQPIAHELLVRVAANSALLHAYLACPQCGRHHSLSPPYGWCWPCGEETRRGERAS